MRYQELNGITDWFESAVDTVSSGITEAADWVSESASESYDWAAEKAAELTAESKATLKDFQDKMNKLFATQDKVDQAIESLPSNSPLRQKLEAKRQESRGMFEEYVLPAWKKFSEWAGFESDSDYGGMGFVVTLGIAAVLGAVAVSMYYINGAQELELEILNDPELKKQYVASHGSSLAAISNIGKYIMWGLGGVAVLYGVNTFRKFTK